MREIAERIVDRLVEHGRDLGTKTIWFSKEYKTFREDAMKYVEQELAKYNYKCPQCNYESIVLDNFVVDKEDEHAMKECEECEECEGAGVVATLEFDNNGNAVEMECPICNGEGDVD